MASSGGVSRGYLRPGLGRSPPFLLIGLIITAGISAFNYWNLSAQYSDLVKEITELQEHVQIVTLKRETAEKHVDALQQRLSESGDQLGQLKVEVDKRKRQERFKDEELDRLHTELTHAAELLKKQNKSLNNLSSVKKELDSVRLQNEILSKKGSVLHNTVANLKTQMAEMSRHLASSQFQIPPIRQRIDSKQEIVATSNIDELKKEVNKGGKMLSDQDERPRAAEENETHMQDALGIEDVANVKENDRNESKNEHGNVDEPFENDMWGSNLAEEIRLDGVGEENVGAGAISVSKVEPSTNVSDAGLSVKSHFRDTPLAARTATGTNIANDTSFTNKKIIPDEEEPNGAKPPIVKERSNITDVNLSRSQSNMALDRPLTKDKERYLQEGATHKVISLGQFLVNANVKSRE